MKQVPHARLRTTKKEAHSTLLSTNHHWTLPDAQRIAIKIIDHPQHIKPLVQALLAGDEELRKRAADVMRRITEKTPGLLTHDAEKIIGAFGESIHTNDNWRTRAHLGLVAARTAHTQQQRYHTAGLLRLLLNDPSNVVRCTALEGLGILAKNSRQLRAEVEPILEEALQTGTLAMKNRAKHAFKALSGK